MKREITLLAASTADDFSTTAFVNRFLDNASPRAWLFPINSSTATSLRATPSHAIRLLSTCSGFRWDESDACELMTSAVELLIDLLQSTPVRGDCSVPQTRLADIVLSAMATSAHSTSISGSELAHRALADELREQKSEVARVEARRLEAIADRMRRALVSGSRAAVAASRACPSAG